MAIVGPAQLPAILQVPSNPLKAYVLAQLGHPSVAIEIGEEQFEIILRVIGDFIAGYFPREQKLAVFYTKPLVPTYPMPKDAYWIQEVSWSPTTTNVQDIFSSESYLYNIGNITGVQNMLLEYHLLQAYRKFSQKVLGTEGHWEVINEGVPSGNRDTSYSDQLIRLYPTPKGTFPVLVLYYPLVSYFRSPQAKQITYDALLAETMMMLGRARRKLNNMPSPAGGNIGFDGGDLVTEGKELKEKVLKQAIDQGEPLGPHLWGVLWWVMMVSTLIGTAVV